MDTVSAPPKHRGLQPWQPGQSGNPNGRPKGSRNKLGEDFIRDIYESWKTKGREVIEKVIETRPQDYLKVVASLLPKEFHIKDDGRMTEEQITDVLAVIQNERAQRRATEANRALAVEGAAKARGPTEPDRVH